MKAASIKANWEHLERRPTWGYASVQDVAKALQISPQSVHNWVGRGHLPPLQKKPGYKGNKRFFEISKIRSFLEGRSEEDIHFEWINRIFPGEKMTLAQAQYTVKICYKIIGVERP